jgi:1-aminocyclopropane-1-carboxylate deaminase
VGSGKVNDTLVQFINQFNGFSNPLDPIYTGKMVYGVLDLMEKKLSKIHKILMIHTGGLQGIQGMNIKLKKTNNYQLLMSCLKNIILFVMLLL